MARRALTLIELLEAIAVIATPAALTWAGAPPLAGHFADEPADSLIRKLEPGPAPELPAGLAVRQQRRWLPGLRLVLIDGTLTHTGKAPAEARSVPVASWAFRVADDQDSARYRPLTWRNDQWYGSAYWTGPDWTRVGKDWHHPGTNTPAVRRFTCPRDGKVTVSGRVCKAHVDPKTDGVRLEIRHGAKTVWQAEIDGGDAQGVEPKLALDVRRGDALRFVVHKRRLIYCDTTHWDPVVAYADGQQFIASKSFAARKQGAGGWSYEMEGGAGGKASLPTLRALDTGFALREETLAAGRAVELSAADALPLFVLADGREASGIVLAVTKGGPWILGCALGKDGRLRVELSAGDVSPKAGGAVPLPQVAVGAYRGSWASGVAALQRLIDTEAPGLKAHLADAFHQAVGPGDPPELALWMMILDDWRQQDGPAIGQATVRAQLGKALALVAELQATHGPGFAAEERRQLEGLSVSERTRRMSPQGARRFYLRVRWLKRRVALANPLVRFGELLFCKRVPTSYSHLVMQYYGWRARPGGGLFVLERPGTSLATRRVFDASKGCVLEPRLSYDARRVVFSYVHCPDGPLPHGPLLNDEDKGFYHLWEANADGSGLRQLTRGPYDDLMPTWLPDGGIAFSSTRRRGYARCFGGQFSRRWHVYTLHRCDADGSNIRTLSFHDTNEWFPAVSNTGHILYARWDYIDRDAVTHQNLWATRPDGTNPMAVWGNATPKPHCTFHAQPIPGSHKILFTAAPHHSIAAGPICILDPTVHDNAQDAITRITPEIPYPEAESRAIREYYAAPWPLSEDYYLVAYSPMPLQWEPRANARNALGLYVLDRWGNRELLYRDPDIGATNPCPLAPRPLPPVLAGARHRSAAVSAAGGTPALRGTAAEIGEFVVLDVYEGLGDVPRGTVKAIRVVQIFPKSTNVANRPPIGIAGEENGRAVLGTAPVEADGSARFLVPARTPVHFQALDADGMAWQTMRSLTYVQPGETTSCIGCHEHRCQAPANTDALALRRPPSRLDPGPFGGRPFAFASVVQPVLDKHCIRCHGGAKPKQGIDLTGAPAHGFSRSYISLVNRRAGGKGAILVPRFKARNQLQITPPGGPWGARGSGLLAMLHAPQGAQQGGAQRGRAAPPRPVARPQRHLLRRSRTRRPGPPARRPSRRHAPHPMTPARPALPGNWRRGGGMRLFSRLKCR